MLSSVCPSRCAGGKRLRLGICSPDSLAVRSLWVTGPYDQREQVLLPSGLSTQLSLVWGSRTLLATCGFPICSHIFINSPFNKPLRLSNRECHLFPSGTLTNTITYLRKCYLVSDRGRISLVQKPILFSGIPFFSCGKRLNKL